MTAIHPFHRVVAATVRAGGAVAVVAPVSGALAPWLRYRCGTAAVVSMSNRGSGGDDRRRRDAGPAPIA